MVSICSYAALVAADNFTSPGFAAVLQPYLFGTLHMSIAESSNTVANSIGVAYILAIFWGYIADSYIGKFYTIVIGAIICTSVRCNLKFP
jgi:dipeptide/tripeptide permease